MCIFTVFKITIQNRYHNEMDEKSGEEVYFEKRLWPKLQEYSIHDDLEKGRNEWTPLFDKDIPPVLITPEDFENIIPMLQDRYNLVENNDLGKCFCGQNIQHHCLILNKSNNCVCWIGNECIYRFKTRHLNEHVATKNKEIIKHINSIQDAIKVNDKLNLLNIQCEKQLQQTFPDEQYTLDANNIQRHAHHMIDNDELKELYKICKIPNEKQINSLRDFPVYADVVERIEKIKTDFNKRLVTKRNGKDYIRVDTLKELNNIIQANLKLYSKYKTYVQNINIHTLIHNQDNENLKDDYLDSIKPTDVKKHYCKDITSLSWKFVGETRNCDYCIDDFYVSIPSQQNITLCKTCYIKDYLKREMVDNIDVRIRVKDAEIISKKYIFTNTQKDDWMDKEPLFVPIRCKKDGCKFYGQVRCNINDLKDIDFFNCWKCSFKTFIEENGYHKLIDNSKQRLKPVHKVLTKDFVYTFSHEAILCYQCIKCKRTEEKLIDMNKYKQKGWKVSFYTNCINCYKNKR